MTMVYINSRPKRFLPSKSCDRCGFLKQASEFPTVRGGGTTDICSECKRKAVSAAMKAKHQSERDAFEAKQQEHFAKALERQRRARGLSGGTEDEPREQ
jgi:hypothetical protein